MIKGGFAQEFYMVSKGQVGVKPNSQIGDCGGEGYHLSLLLKEFERYILRLRDPTAKE